MLARKQQKARLKQAKAILKERGWTYRDAAPVLNVHFTHLCRVLTGSRKSEALLRRIHEIPVRNAQP
jgi:predicted transcriptional regulator